MSAPQPSAIVRIITRMNIGGPSLHVALLTNRLDGRRFRTHLVVGRPDADEGDLSGGIDEAAAARVTRVDALRRPLHPWRDGRAFLRLLRILWQEQPAIIHTHMAKAGALGRLAGVCYNTFGPGRRKQGRALLVHTFHGHVLDGYFSDATARLFVIIERWLARRTDCLVAVSEAVKRDILAKGIGDLRQWEVIPLGLDLAPLACLPLPGDEAAPHVGLVGRLVPIKNPALFLEGLGRAFAHKPSIGWQAAVVGDGPLRPGLQQQAEALGLGQSIRFTGWQRDLPGVYASLGITCLTSWNEGTPVALIEAMAAGRVVIATDVGGVRDVVGDPEPADCAIDAGGYRLAQRGILVRPGDAEGLAQALIRAGEDSALRLAMGQRARAFVVRQYGQQRLVGDISRLYERLLAGEHPCMC